MKVERTYTKAHGRLTPASNIVTVTQAFGVRTHFFTLGTPGPSGTKPDDYDTGHPLSPWLICFQEERCGAGTRQVQDGHDVSQQPTARCHSAETEPLAAA
jgi:hypothetical protein